MKIHKSEKIGQAVDSIDVGRGKPGFWEWVSEKSWALWCTTYRDVDDKFNDCIEFGMMITKQNDKYKIFRVDRDEHIYFFMGTEDEILTKLKKIKVEAENYL